MQQFAPPIGNRLRPVLDLQLQRPVDRAQKRRPVRAERTLGGRLVVVAHDAGWAIGRPPPGHRLIQRGAKRVDVGPRALTAPGQRVLLIGAVAGLDQRADGLGQLHHLAARRAKIDQHRHAIIADDDVVGCDVAMQEIVAVDQLERVEQGADYLVEFGLARRAAQPRQPRLEALAFLELQHHVGGIVRPEVAEHPDDVAVIEFRQRLRLFDETLEAPQIVFPAVLGLRLHRQRDLAHGEIGGKILLDGNPAVERRFTRQIGDAEPASAQHALDLVIADQLRARGQSQQIVRSLCHSIAPTIMGALPGCLAWSRAGVGLACAPP